MGLFIDDKFVYLTFIFNHLFIIVCSTGNYLIRSQIGISDFIFIHTGHARIKQGLKSSAEKGLTIIERS